MAQELQGLLDRIQQDGLKKADSAKEQILTEAKAEAERIRLQARNDADALLKKAQDDAAGIQARAQAAIQQAARDIILTFKEDLKNRLTRLVKGAAAETLTPAFLGQILLAIAKSQSADTKLEVLVSSQDLDKLTELVRSSLTAELQKAPTISLGQDIGAGLKLNFNGNDVYFDFTDDAITELICNYIGPRLAALLEPTPKA